MANEITVTCQLNIRKGNTPWISQPPSYRADMVKNLNGPTPGAVTVGVNHTDISLGQLTALGGFCFLQNLDLVNFVEVGVRDTVTNKFIAFLELYPLEQAVVRLSRYLLKELTPGTGTGQTGDACVLCAKADIAPVVLAVNAFDP
jgi:hypothetical protein